MTVNVAITPPEVAKLPGFLIGRVPMTGSSFGGWAREDGTFTAGRLAVEERWEAAIFSNAYDAVKFARWHGWIIIN